MKLEPFVAMGDNDNYQESAFYQRRNRKNKGTI
jgi:hypothetical protein